MRDSFFINEQTGVLPFSLGLKYYLIFKLHVCLSIFDIVDHLIKTFQRNRRNKMNNILMMIVMIMIKIMCFQNFEDTLGGNWNF